ncbi:M23 family metallopeptidase [Streptomyces sp. NPDC019937]|uniref:M23 family metallopeptidase n=1 Tax=Streptomyces sp. NPDC019937 TaxID=3154787 RepID=UPI0033C7D14D
MAPRATTRRYPQSHSSLARARAAVIAVGVGASLVLGAGVTFAADAHAAAAAPARAVEAKKADTWVTPVATYVLGAPFGLAGNLWAHNHSGQDFVVPSGTSVRAVHTGVVVKAGPYGAGDGPAYGNAIVVKHDDNTYSQYAHLSRIDVRIGQSVTTGQHIGLSGNTGNTTGPHLHFEIRTTPNYGSAVGPLTFLRAHGLKV